MNLSIAERGRGGLRVLTVAVDTEMFVGDDDSVALVSRAGAGPGVVMWARASEGPAYCHRDRDDTGSRFGAEEAISSNLPVAYDTGELLGLGDALPLGDTGLEDHGILCEPAAGPACRSLLRGDFTPLAAGSLTCDEEKGTMTFVSEGESGATLVFELARSPSVLQCREAIRSVASGEPLGYAGLYVVSATGRDGSPVSVLTTRDGVVYVSWAVPKFGCPCRMGS
jgi:hypothetical protein